MAQHALGEVRADYSAAAQIIDALIQKAEMPFGTKRRFASKLTDFGWSKELKLQDIPFAEVARIYQEQAKAKLPLTEQEFREVISAEYMVFGRTGLGGPQIKEATRLMANTKSGLDLTLNWANQQKGVISRIGLELDDRFRNL